jgi:L-threonylcarbamoyladenylate synthase
VTATVIRSKDPNALRAALHVLRRGGLVAFPTDTVYGVGALAFDAAAVARLYLAKGREAVKAIPVLLADQTELAKVAEEVPANAVRLADAFWPGALTVVLRKRDTVPEAVSQGGTVGVRVPAHPVALALLQAAGPLAVTSANRSGEADSMTAAEVAAGLGDQIELILDGGVAPGGKPSTVVDCTGSAPTIVRQGPISLDQIFTVLGRPEG